MDKNKLIKALRLKLSVSFSAFLYLYFYVDWLILTAMRMGRFWDGVPWLIFLCVWNFLVFLMSYFIFYKEKIINKLIFEDISGIKIFFTQVGKHLFLGASLWGILGIRGYVMNAPAWMIMVPIGAVLGFIFGIISSVNFIILRKKVKRN